MKLHILLVNNTVLGVYTDMGTLYKVQAAGKEFYVHNGFDKEELYFRALTVELNDVPKVLYPYLKQQ